MENRYQRMHEDYTNTDADADDDDEKKRALVTVTHKKGNMRRGIRATMRVKKE